jgi:Ca2+-binding RTX toxin-like protein
VDIENVAGSEQADTIRGNASANRLEGWGGADVLIGGDGHDTLLGGRGNDELYGEKGDDWLDGGSGDDRVDGGLGVDSASYQNASWGVSVDLSNCDRQNTSGGGRDILVDIENLYGTAFADTLKGDGEDNLLSGGRGADVLIGREGDDVLLGGLGNDSLYGEKGDDWLVGGLGNDRIDGGEGFDWASYEAHTYGVFIDMVFDYEWPPGAEIDRFHGIEAVRGSTFNDTLLADAGSNQLQGWTGDDRLEGRGGDDVLQGGLGNDELYGGDGHDQVYGGAGVDTLQGGAGNDLLQGGGGADKMRGGAGADRFVFAHAADLSSGAGDEVMDFDSRYDVIDLSGIDADTTTEGNQAFSLVDTFGNKAGQARLVSDSDDTTFFQADTDGDGEVDLSFAVNGTVQDGDGFVL